MGTHVCTGQKPRKKAKKRKYLTCWAITKSQDKIENERGRTGRQKAAVDALWGLASRGSISESSCERTCLHMYQKIKLQLHTLTVVSDLPHALPQAAVGHVRVHDGVRGGVGAAVLLHSQRLLSGGEQGAGGARGFQNQEETQGICRSSDDPQPKKEAKNDRDI